MSHGHKQKDPHVYLIWETSEGVTVTDECPRGVKVLSKDRTGRQVWTYGGDSTAKEYVIGVDGRLVNCANCPTGTPIGVYNPRNPHHLKKLVAHTIYAVNRLNRTVR